MESQDEQFLAALRAAFAIEAAEHLEGLASGLIELEKLDSDAARAPIVEVVYREIHSLKGAARAVDNTPIETICQALENLLAAWKRGQIVVSPELFDALHQASDAAAQALLRPHTELERSGITGIVTRVNAVLESSQRRSSPNPPSTTPVSAAKPELPRPELPRPEQASNELPDNAPTDQKLVRVTDYLPPSLPQTDSTQLTSTQVTSRQVNVSEANSRDVNVTDVNITDVNVAEVRTSVVASEETVRIGTTKLDELLRGAEELLVWKQIAGERAAQLRETGAQFALWHREWQKVAPQLSAVSRSESQTDPMGGSASVTASGSAPVQPIGNSLTEFLRWNQTLMDDLENRVTIVSRAAEGDRRALGGLIDHLLEDAKRLLMLPFSHISGVFARVVRDVAREQGKQIAFELRGESVELDKRILEAIKEPLIHLLRNSVDHGVETPIEREKRGKPRVAFIELSVAQNGGEVEICLSDDGGGIDDVAVRKSALKAGLLSPEEAERLTPDAARWLIFQSSLSTSALVTEISGRGLGMTIVREKVEALGGRIELESQTGSGTTFRLFLPLTLATFRGVLVESGGQKFVLPASDVERVVRVTSQDLGLVHGKMTLNLPREETSAGRDLISYASLSEVLSLQPSITSSSITSSSMTSSTSSSSPQRISRPNMASATGQIWKMAVVLRRGDARLALEVEEVIGEQEILVKPLSRPLLRVRNIAGATILGSGQVVPILNVADLFGSAQNTRVTAPVAPTEEESPPRRILVAEDSITSRMLLKNILESAGYVVETAVDGLNAWKLLQNGGFDLLVSDVDMPHLDGLDLTAQIRAEPRLSATPVILVTSRSTREDRERGVDVGADAYIVKSRFDQHDLLDVVARFLPHRPKSSLNKPF